MPSNHRTSFAAWLTDELPDALAAFLPSRRWFGGRGFALSGITLEDAWWPVEGDGRSAVVIAGVPRDGRLPDRYVLYLRAVEQAGGLPVVGVMNDAGVRLPVVEATVDPASCARLIAALALRPGGPTLRGGRFAAGDLSAPAKSMLADPALSVQPLGSEQSNTSIRVGGDLVFKLIRRLDRGESPELEVGRFLTTRTSFKAMCALRGSLSYTEPGGAVATAGVLQDWVDNRGDGWSYVLAALADYLRTGEPGTIARDLRQLGEITAEFHAAMASDRSAPDFAPVPIDSGHVTRWQTQLRDRLTSCLELAERPDPSWPSGTDALLAEFRGAAERISALASSAIVAGGFDTIRIHGDYHLGQTLKTDRGFVVIDFEGEPLRPIAERREKSCALRDAAGMLRSLDYAAETAAAGFGGGSAHLREDLRLREAFLAGYFGAPALRGAGFLPSGDEARRRWIAFFELDKALYELEYEIRHRPSWITIPLRGILAAVDA